MITYEMIAIFKTFLRYIFYPFFFSFRYPINDQGRIHWVWARIWKKEAEKGRKCAKMANSKCVAPLPPRLPPSGPPKYRICAPLPNCDFWIRPCQYTFHHTGSQSNLRSCEVKRAIWSLQGVCLHLEQSSNFTSLSERLFSLLRATFYWKPSNKETMG